MDSSSEQNMEQPVHDASLAEIQEETIPVKEYLAREMLRKGLKKRELADELGIHRQTLYNILSGNRRISYKVALKLSKRFEEPADFWMKENVRVASGPLEPTSEPRKDNAAQTLELASSKPISTSPQILVDFEIEEVIEKGLIHIDPFDPSNVKSASMDLTVGLLTQKPFDGDDDHKQSTGNTVSLKSQESINIVVKERVRFGKDYLARVGQITHNAARGLLVMHGIQIDPGYAGSLHIRAVNLTPEKISISVGDPILSLEIVRLSKTPREAFQNHELDSIEGLAHRIEEALRGLFDVTKGPDNTLAASWPEAEIYTDGGTKIQALDKAIKTVCRELEGLKKDSPYITDVIRAEVAKRAGELVITEDDVYTLARKAGVHIGPKLDIAIAPYTQNEAEWQPLGPTCRRLGLNLNRVILAYLGRESWANVRT